MTALLTELELRALLQRDEGQFLEFKSFWDLRPGSRMSLDRRRVRNDIAENVAAFANADGGTLILGVEDSGAPSGHGYPPEAIDDFLTVPERRLRPPVRVDWQRVYLDGHEILVCQVAIAPQAVMVDGNGFPYRTGDSVIREPQAVIDERKQAYRQIFGVTRHVATRELRQLVQGGYLELVGERRGARYLPGPAFGTGSTE